MRADQAGRPDDELARKLRADLEAIVLERTQLGFSALVVGVLLFEAINLLAGPQLGAWPHLMNVVLIVAAAGGFFALRYSTIRRHAVVMALLSITLVFASRAMAGAWQGDAMPTVIMSVAVALACAAMVPWGFGPQLLVTALAGGAIAFDVYVVAPAGGLSARSIALVAVTLGVALFISVESFRSRVRLLSEGIQRRRAEEALAQLNQALEQRVADRTEELEAAKRSLEAEAAERQQAVLKLGESRERFQLILDNAAAVIHVKDLGGRYLFVNRHWERLFHARSEDVVGKAVTQFHSQEILDPLLENDRKVLESRQSLEFEETLIQDGALHTFLSVKFPLVDTSGRAFGVCGISTDITARKAMEAELRRSEAALETLIDNTTDAIWSIDRNFQVTVVNPAARQRFREYFHAEFDPVHASEHMPPDLVREMVVLYQRAFAGERIEVEQARDLADGSRHHFLVLVNPIREGGQVAGATVFARDITELKQAEQQAREHRTQLAHVLRLGTMGEMASGLAHEINQPLGAIANYARGCVRRLRAGSGDQTELLRAVDEIAREALRAGEIIRRLRELVRKESPRQEPVDVNRLVREAVDIIEPEARRAGISLRLAAAPDLPRVACDGIQIEQVILNLLLNGVDALEAAGNGERTLEIETVASLAGAVEVAVSDNGVGLPAPPVDVFAPFFSTKTGGLGMGLSISRSIIEAHGGRLWATANYERGSTFRFTLPPGRITPA
ncbi:MAG TPA: PAS domain S-box protein [Candidatus Bathyarchaeia archaeon]|nr:PAS domain S-box protein [Candidatus Bathyarchaeia archaeon]